jgi:integrase/recombinase XerD
MWNIYKKGFKSYLQLEKSLSDNSVEAYIHDLDKFIQFLLISNLEISPKEVELQHLENFLQWISKLGMTPSSQARIISGLRNFYKYCLQEQI